MSGKTEENLAATLRQKNPRSRVNMCPENFVVRLTPARAYYINQLNQTRVKLEILGKIKNDFLYKKLDIFDCTCLLDNIEFCGTCLTTSYNMSSVARLFQKQLFVHVTYDPLILVNFLPNVHFFAGIFIINVDRLKMEVKSVNFLEQTGPLVMCGMVNR